MNFEIDFSPLPDYVIVKTEGLPSAEGFENIMKALVGSPKWRAGTKQLVDHRNLLFKDLSAQEMRQIVGVIRKYSAKLGNGACAFVVKTDLGFGLARMYEMSGGEGLHVQVGIFYSIDEAVKWLKG